MADIKELRFYSHQDNIINSKFMKIANVHIRLLSVTFIGDTSTYYNPRGYSSDEDKEYFEFVADGLTYSIIAENEMCKKINEKMVQWVFPTQDKVYI